MGTLCKKPSYTCSSCIVGTWSLSKNHAASVISREVLSADARAYHTLLHTLLNDCLYNPYCNAHSHAASLFELHLVMCVLLPRVR